ncbi:Putative anti-sigma factor [hydrothermal vent metagenome]|uniref:Anti-sigma factor n=1 Tax=hydrothermal vent metagenome TaxID=652676 RepID=A0A3B0U0Q6_9ZZZZ
MQMRNQSIEELLPSYFDGVLNKEDMEKVEAWKEASKGNRQLFADSLKVWEGIEHLLRMKKYNAEKALENVNIRIEKRKSLKLFTILQKVAAVLILPLLVATLYFATKTPTPKITTTEWHTINTPAGLRSEFILPDGTKVYLNSKTSLSYPIAFNNSTRDVKLTGEAYFEVAENKKQPFIVNTGKIKVEVTGTEFKASNYPDENLTEIVLASGKINLFQGEYSKEKEILRSMVPGEKATYYNNENKIYFEKVNVDKYISWKDGILMFRDDSMQEVVRRLNRWFNVDITLTGNKLKDYVYTATFQDESLIQILDLLKLSAPIDYSIKRRERKSDQTFSKMKIVIMQK